MKRLHVMVTCATVLLLLALGLWLGWTFQRTAREAVYFEHHSTALKIEQVQRLGELTSLRVPISDVQTAAIHGYVGGVSVVLVVHGDVVFSVDLEQAKFTSVDAEHRRAVLLLPQPRPGRPRLDQSATKVYRVDRSGLWALYPGQAGEGAVVERAMEQAQVLLLKSVDQPDLYAQARAHAKVVLCEFCQALGWSIEVQWQG